MRLLIKIFHTVFEQRSLLWQLALHQLKQQYATTMFGSFWAVIQPIAIITIFWFVFSYGLKIEFAGTDVPYFLILFTGIIPWMCFSDILSSSTNSIISYGYLVKKIAFPLEILPLVHIIVAVIIHLITIIFLIIILMVNNIWPTLYSIQILYYLFAMIFFSMGLTWLSSSFNTFHRDVGQSINVLMTLWFWITPIIWSPDQLTGIARKIITVNPMYYIVNGYRKSLLYNEFIFTNWYLDVYFWFVTVILLIMGAIIFFRLKPHFAEVI